MLMLIVILALIFVLGWPLEWVPIVLIVVPIVESYVIVQVGQVLGVRGADHHVAQHAHVVLVLVALVHGEGQDIRGARLVHEPDVKLFDLGFLDERNGELGAAETLPEHRRARQNQQGVLVHRLALPVRDVDRGMAAVVGHGCEPGWSTGREGWVYRP